MGVGLALAMALVGGSAAAAQDFIRADCRQHVENSPAPGADALTRRWYRRFWTGECAGLSGCMGGAPNWNGVVGELVARSPEPQHAAVLAKACRLGPLIGVEWTRPRNVRRIDSGDLRSFNATLKAARAAEEADRVDRHRLAGPG